MKSATSQSSAERDADEGRNALAAFEAEPHRKQVAEKGAERRNRHEGLETEIVARQHHGDKALAAVEEERGRRRPACLPVRSTLVAPILPEPSLRTSPAPASQREDQAEWNGAEK